MARIFAPLSLLSWSLCLLASTASALWFSAAANAALPRPDEATVWIVCEPTQNREQLELALSVQPEAILRGWFKWWQADDWEEYRELSAEAEKRGILFGGGVTCSALKQGENGLNDAQFLRMVSRTPTNQPAVFQNNPSSGCHHGAIESREYQDYVLTWAYRQIDAGVTMLFMDEVDGASTEQTGFGDEAMKQFRSYLVAKYVNGKGWKSNDVHWFEAFKIRLDDKLECADGTINSFDYRSYLKRMGALEQPFLSGKNPLAAEWGAPSDATDETYCGSRNRRAWEYMVQSIRAYAAKKGRPLWITANGLNGLVDYQTVGVWENWPVKDGRLSVEPCFVTRWRGAIDFSRRTLGREAPVVVFHDWGFGIPWEKIPREDRILWLRVYAPEVFASGAFFAWPMSGCGGSTRADRNGTYEEIWHLARWYKAHSELYHNAEWMGLDLAKTEPLVVTTMVQQPAVQRRLVHVINKKCRDGQLVPREKFVVRVPSGSTPRAVWVVSPDFGDRKAAKFTWGDGMVAVEMERLDAYNVVILEYDKLPDDDALILGRLVLGTEKRWGQRGGSEFAVTKRGLGKTDGPLSGYLHGQYHKEMRVTPQFKGEFGPDAAISVKINSVAVLGAELLVLVDGQRVAREIAPDKDGKNEGSVGEYNKTVTARIPPGAHVVTLENAGGDWMTIDEVVFEGLR
jgi:hypothetical protein